MNTLSRSQGWMLHGGLLAVAIAFPLIFSSPFWVNFGVLALFYAFIGQSWNISGGFAGQLSFGHVVFFGAGAYSKASDFMGAGAWRRGLGYGLLGLPLAFVALPLYVILPNHYAREFGAPLALLGLVLLAARLVDAVLDPIIGRWCDRLFARSIAAVLGASAVSAVVLALGLWGLLFPPAGVREAGTTVLLAWAGTCVTFSGVAALLM